MFTQFEAPPGVLQEKHIVYQNSRGQFFTTVNCHQKPEQHFYRSFEITYSRAVPLENPVRDCFTQEQSPGISMAPGAQRTSNTSNNIHVYRVPRSIYGTHYVPRRVTTITTNDNDWKNDILTQSLTKQVAYILYHREPTSDHRKVALRFTHLHEHEQISKLLGQYEPGGQVDREALKAILEHIEPLVKTEKINLQLYSFVKDFVMLRQEWLKAAGDQYGLLAYLDVCQEWGLAGAGPSYANQLVDLNVELQGLQARHGTPPRFPRSIASDGPANKDLARIQPHEPLLFQALPALLPAT